MQQQAPEIKPQPSNPKVTCFRCGKPGHMAKDCPDMKGKVSKIRSILDSLDDEERAALEQDFQEDL